ncbi:cyclodeaminase/cyclohydrolase family protein [Zhaonella formicivorans]|uniref:cyclodeaminase/cyclohydrolase family protein n=1 Tax=Zhaonella formicivorans TaxID=2528593 RepID=UPI001D127ECE|nr:cyclodeaminase/cyclohydrolase family protein [Zhaonella formicivorans]
MELVKMSVEEFLAELASESPAPGGGSVSALAAANAAALCEMVCNLTLGKEKYQEVAEEFSRIKSTAAELQARLRRSIDLDTEAFNQVMVAFKLPKGTEEEKAIRSQAIQDAYCQAIDVPFSVVEACVEILKLIPEIAAKGNQNALSDAGVAANIALAGMEGAILNVRINLPYLKDETLKQKLYSKLEGLREEGKTWYKKANEIVENKL